MVSVCGTGVGGVRRIGGTPVASSGYGQRPSAVGGFNGGGGGVGASPAANVRSNSAIDLQAVHRATQRSRPVVSSGYGTVLRQCRAFLLCFVF